MAEKHCNGCGTDKNPSTIPFAVYQMETTKNAMLVKRLIWIIVLLIVLLVGSNIGWLIYESQFEVVEETITTFEDVVQESAEGSNNIVGGDFVNGEANN